MDITFPIIFKILWSSIWFMFSLSIISPICSVTTQLVHACIILHSPLYGVLYLYDDLFIRMTLSLAL